MYYYFFIWFVIVIANLFVTYKTYIGKIFFIFLMLFLCGFIGLRYEIGGDWYNYQAIYELFFGEKFTAALGIAEPGYSLLNILGVYFEFKDTLLVNLLSSFIIISFLYLTFIKLKYYWQCLLVYYPCHILTLSLGYTRQSIAVAIITYSFIKLFENKKISFIFYVILASMFHRTAILLLIFYPLQLLMNRRNISILYQFFSLFLITALLYISSLYDSNIYTSNDSEISSSGVFMRIALHIIPLLCYFSFRKKIFLNNNERQLLDYFVMLVIYCLFLAFAYSTLVDRFNFYLIFFDLFVIVSTYKYLNPKSRVLFISVLVMFYTIFILTWLLNSRFVLLAWTPYQNYLTDYLLNYVF
ncbi:EpsG family protein [Acinetobacter baumannii]|uniref:EpsG family protein n=1 Tax=Acinetobacter baumannii TaxID=470 RepID=UPI00332EB63B